MEKKQLKRIFNKNIFKDKSFIKMVCFIIVLLLVLVLGSNFGYVSADSGYLLNATDYQSSSIYDSNMNYSNWFGGAQNEVSAFIYDYLSTDLDISSLDTPSAFDSSNYSQFVVFGGSPSYDYYVYLTSEDSFFFIPTPYSYGWTIVQKNLDEIANFEFTYTDPNNVNTCTVLTDSFDIIHSSTYWTVGNDRYYLFNVPGSAPETHKPVYSNMNYYSFKLTVPYDSYSAYMQDYLTNGNHSEDVKNINYLVDSVGLHGFENTFPSGSTDLGSLPENNMYVDYADWYLNNYNGNIAGNFRNMSVSFTTNLNDYINNQLANETGTSSSDWVVYVDYSAFIDFYYKSVTDYGNLQLSFDLGENFASVSYTTPDITSTNVYHWSASYEFPLYDGSDLGYNSAFDNVFHSPHNGYNTGFFMDAKKFADKANYVWTCPFSGLFAYMTPTSNSRYTNSNGVSFPITADLYGIMEMVDNNMINWSPEYEGLNQFKLTCSAQIMYAGNDLTVDYTSGWYTETFNLLTGESTLGSDSMLTNYNPYIDNNNTDYSTQLPSTSTGSSSTSVTTGNVTQTVTVSNEGAKYIPSIISSLIPSSFGDTSTGLASRFTTLVDSNNFITVMANTVPAIPTTVWTYLTEYLGISLYLLACAFVLRLILDLL